jgi:hypothetical protein
MAIIPLILIILGSMFVFSVFFSTGIFFKNSHNKPLSPSDDKLLNFSGGMGLIAVLGLLGILLVMIII